MTTVEVLVRARELIADPERWTQGYVARTADGHPTAATNPEAARWCGIGACDKVADSQGAFDVDRLLNDIALDLMPDYDEDESDEPPFGHFNDTHSHAEVLAALDKAIEEAQS